MSAPRIPIAEYNDTTFEDAVKLPYESQLRLKVIETAIRDAIREDPALAPVYHVLRRQLYVKEELAMELYVRLDARHASTAKKEEETLALKEAQEQQEEGKKETRAGKGEKGVEPISAPNAHVAPPVIPSAPRAMQSAPMNKDLFCRCGIADLHNGKRCPRDARNPPPPPPPPPRSTMPLQGTKRDVQQAFGAPEVAKKKTAYVPYAGDWRCVACGYWNFQTSLYCCGRGSKDGKCGVDAKIAREVQKEGPGIEKRKTGAKFFGDWQCRCRCWNREHFKRCSRCPGLKDGFCIGQDWDDSLEHLPDYTPTTSLLDDYWTGGDRHPEAYNGGSSYQYHSSMAAYYGTKGAFKESRNAFNPPG